MKLVVSAVVVICAFSHLECFSEAWSLPSSPASSLRSLLPGSKPTAGEVVQEEVPVIKNTELEPTGKWSLGQAISGSISAASNLASSALNTTKSVTGGVINGVKGAASSAVDTAKGVATAALDLALQATETAVNAGVDFFLKQYKFLVKAAHLEEIPLPPVLTSAYFLASFEARNGFFRSLASLSKDGDIIIKRNGTSLKIDVPLKFDDLEVGYKNYSMSVARIGTSGSISVAVKSNKVRLTLVLNLSTKCAISLENISFLDMEGLEVKFTGLCYYCGSISSRVATYIVNFVQKTVKNLIQDKLDSMVKATLSENSMLCAKFLSG